VTISLTLAGGMRQLKVIFATALVVLCCARPALAVIEALTPLKKFQADATAIVSVKVERLDLEKQTAVLTVEKLIAGEFNATRIPLRLAGDSDGDPADMLDRLEVGQRLVLFVTETPGQSIGYAYTRGSWFQIIGTRAGERVVWQFTHAEPYLRRTFHGETHELVELLRAGKDLPEPDEKEKPGLGAKIDRTAEAVAEPELLPDLVAPPETSGEPVIVSSTVTETIDNRPWYVFAATILIGLAGIVYLRMRGGPA
jgi:hypothetical protein